MKYKALSFDGVDDYVEVPYSSSLDGFDELTISLWVYPTAYGHPNYYRYIIDKGWACTGSFVLYLDKDIADRIWFFTRDSAGMKGAYATLELNKWQHIVCLFKRGQRNKIYINGVKGTDSPPSADEPLSLTTPVRIAQSTYDYQGLIDEVRIYNRALTPEEIKALYYHKPILDGLVLWFMPQREYKGTWWDRSGCMNHGTIYGATPSTEEFNLRPLRVLSV